MIALDANITKEGHANMKNTNENLEEEYSGPSKSELKRRAEHLQDLGKELTTWVPETLAKSNFPKSFLKPLRIITVFPPSVPNDASSSLSANT